jgi:histone H3/H4
MTETVRETATKALIVKAGARATSHQAIDRLSEILTELGYDIAKEAIDLTEHTSRKTVHASDIQLAYKKVLYRRKNSILDKISEE